MQLQLAILMQLHNLNGFCSSQPYLLELLKCNDIIGVSEHWLSGPELFRLKGLSDTHNVTSKCNNDLLHCPPARGRGYGGVAIYWNKNVPASPIVGIKSDRLIGVELTMNGTRYCIINVYLPSSNAKVSEFNEAIDELHTLITEYYQTCNMVVMGDFNVSLGNLGGPRGDGMCSDRGLRCLNALRNENIELICCDMAADASGPAYSFHKEGLGASWIDHIFISSSMANQVVECKIIEEKNLNVSDHLPIVLALKTPLSNVPSGTDHVGYKVSKTVRWNKLSVNEIEEKYTTNCNVTFQGLHDELMKGKYGNNVNAIADRITKELSLITENNVSNRKHRNTSSAKPFWNSELSDFVKL